jgi:hypothetical protein
LSIPLYGKVLREGIFKLEADSLVLAAFTLSISAVAAEGRACLWGGVLRGYGIHLSRL